MKEHNKTTIGLFSKRADAEQAIDQIHKMGLGSDEISIILRDDEAAHELAAEAGATIAKAATAGAGTGAAAGGVTGLLLGLGALAIPGIGPVLAAGPLTAALAAGAAVGAATGGIIGVLAGMGVSKEEAAIYEEAVRKGDILVAVGTTADNDESVERTLERYAAREVKTVGAHLRDVRAHGHGATA